MKWSLFWKGVLIVNALAVVGNIVESAAGLIPPLDAGEVWRHALAGLLHLGLLYYLYEHKPTGV